MSNQLYLGANKVDNVYVDSTKASAVYLGANKVWPTSPLAGVNIGDPFMGGYYAGIIDTTKGNIITADASQAGLRYALIVAGIGSENASLPYEATTGSAMPSACSTLWDGLTATQALAGAGSNYSAATYCAGLSYPDD